MHSYDASRRASTSCRQAPASMQVETVDHGTEQGSLYYLVRDVAVYVHRVPALIGVEILAQDWCSCVECKYESFASEIADLCPSDTVPLDCPGPMTDSAPFDRFDEQALSVRSYRRVVSSGHSHRGERLAVGKGM